MKALLLKGPGEVVLEEIPVPEILDNEVLVEVKYCGICGTDVHSVKSCLPFKAGTYLGHEFSGQVAKVGRNVEKWKVEDRVVVRPRYMCGECYACRHGRHSLCDYGFECGIGFNPGKENAGAFAKFVRVPLPKWRLLHLPNEVSFEKGALVEPLACSLHAVRISTLRPGDHTMVLGAGTIGLGVIAHLKNAGAGLIIATETIEQRAELARKLGADYVFNPQVVSRLKERVLKLTNGLGVDIIFDCSGVPQAFSSATKFLRRGGQIILVGVIEREVPFLPMNFTYNEWEIKGSIAYYADEFPMVIEFLKREISSIEQMITSKIRLSNIVEQGFDLLRKPIQDEIKILVQPDE